MATLNTLRTRGGIIVSMVIGLALIAFLLSDLNSQGSSLLNSRKMRVGKIDGTPVGYVEYSGKVDQYTTISKLMTGSDALSTEDQENVRNSAWEALIHEHALRPGFVELGLVPGDEEQVDMVSGIYLSPVITGTFRNPQYGYYDPSILKGFIENTQKDVTGQSAMLWDYLKAQMVDQRAMTKFFTLISNGFFVTDIEASEGVRQGNNSYDIDYVGLPYASIPDSTITVGKAEIEKYYNRHQKQFHRTASRDVRYVIFSIEPSQKDYDDAQARVDELAGEFRVSANPMQYANLNSQGTPDNRFYSLSGLDAAIGAVLFDKPGVMYGPVLNNDIYTMARLSEMKMLPDSVGARHILLPASDKERADSLVRVLRAGGNFTTLAMTFSTDQNTSMRGGDMGFFDPQLIVQPLGDALVKASKGEIFTSTTRFGIHIVELTYKAAPVKKAQIATVTYNVEASAATEQDAYSQAGKFRTAAAGSTDNFDKAATEQALFTRSAHILNTDRIAGGLPDSRELVRWAFNADKGAVSNIMTISNNYVVATLVSTVDDGMAPLESVTSDIRGLLIRQKKGDQLSARLSAAGKSLSEVAGNVNEEIKSAGDVQFNSFYIDGVGLEQQLIGAVSQLGNPSMISTPVTGNSAVFVFEITTVKNVNDATPASERVRLEATAQSYLNERAGHALIEESNVVDYRAKFF
ncbi:peptidylprolyl isomerase [Bacteroidia bacterium]|nr:peptidylprolyl isomerase [Bacteroidia bacterium]